MPKSFPLQINFAAGELSENVISRLDLEGYRAGAQVMENFVTLPQGPFYKRYGFVHKGYHNGRSSFAIGFPVDNEQAFVLFITGGSDILAYDFANDTVVDTGVNDIYDPADVHELQIAFVPDAYEIYIVHRNYVPYKLTYDKAAGTWTYTVISFTAQPAQWQLQNWPGTIAFHQGRSWWGGTPDQPETIWASKSGAYTNMTVGTAADDGMVYTLANKGAICWMLSHKKLLLGTVNSEYVIEAEGGLLTPSDAEANRQSGYGSAYIQAVLAGNKVLYVSSDQQKIRDLNYQWTEEGWVSRDITFVSDHIFKNDKIRKIDYAPTIDLLTVATESGKMAFATYERGNDVIGWHKHPITGNLVSIATVDYEGKSRVVGSFDRVSRQIAATNVSEIEVMEEDIYFDCCEKYEGSNVIPNPSFEVDESDWTLISGSGGRTGIHSYDGSWSYAIQKTGVNSPSLRSSLINVGADKPFIGHSWIYIPTTISNGTAKRVAIYVIDGILGMGRIYASKSFSLDTPGWQKVEMNGVTISTTVDVKFAIEFSSSSPPDIGDTIYVDDVTLVLTIPQAINIPRFASELVGCKIDGAVYPDLLFDSNGDATLPIGGADVQLGFNYISRFASLPLINVAQGASTVPFNKVVSQVFAKIISSAYPKINGKRPPTRTPSTPMDTPEELKSELIKSLSLGYEEEKTFEIVQDLPLKTKIAGLYAILKEEHL